jgi:acetyl-CoA carboxylase alpha subunit
MDSVFDEFIELHGDRAYADDNEKKVKTIYRFHKLVFDIGESRLEHVNRASQNYELWPPVPVRYVYKRSCISLKIITVINTCISI